MYEIFLKTYRGYSIALWAFATVAGISTFAIMTVITLNAVLRKGINWPLPAALEVTQALLVVAIILPFAFTQFLREHVSTVFFTSRLSMNAQRWLHCFWCVVAFVLFVSVTYGTFQYALRSYAMNEQIWGATIQFPVWPAKMAISLGTALAAIQFLLDAIGYAFVPHFREQADKAAELNAHV